MPAKWATGWCWAIRSSKKELVHLEAGDMATARQMLEEGRDIALALGNAELTFSANVLRAQIILAEGNRAEALRQLSQLQALARTEREEAAVHYELRTVADNPVPHHIRALALYRSLYAKTPQYLYKLRVLELEKEEQ
jgi:hypothetical protein